MKRLIVPIGMTVTLIVGGAGLAATAATAPGPAPTGAAQPVTAGSTDALTDHFSDFAGSSANAQSLVQGLRTGSAITLSGSTGQGSVTFQSPTSPLGNGEVAVSLGLAQQSLAGYGIDDPTPQQLQAALVGGTVTAPDGSQVRLAGVLALRQSGMGWGKIAQTYGVKLGDVVSDTRPGAETDDAHDADAAQAATDQDVDSEAARPEAADVDHGDAEEAARTRPDVDRPQVAEANEARPDVDVPDVDHPDVSRPQVQRPDVQRPQVQKPDIQKPDVERPDN